MPIERCRDLTIIQPLTMWHLFGLEHAGKLRLKCYREKGDHKTHAALTSVGKKKVAVTWNCTHIELKELNSKEIYAKPIRELTSQTL